MTVGVKRSDKSKVQYCITAIDTGKIKQEADWPPVNFAPRLRGGITSWARIKLAGTSHYPLSIRITVYYLVAKVAIIIQITKPRWVPPERQYTGSWIHPAGPPAGFCRVWRRNRAQRSLETGRHWNGTYDVGYGDLYPHPQPQSLCCIERIWAGIEK